MSERRLLISCCPARSCGTLSAQMLSGARIEKYTLCAACNKPQDQAPADVAPQASDEGRARLGFHARGALGAPTVAHSSDERQRRRERRNRGTKEGQEGVGQGDGTNSEGARNGKQNWPLTENFPPQVREGLPRNVELEAAEAHCREAAAVADGVRLGVHAPPLRVLLLRAPAATHGGELEAGTREQDEERQTSVETQERGEICSQ